VSAAADEPVLRDAGRDDLPALTALHVAAFRETHGGGPSVPFREEQWRAKFDAGRLIFCLLLELRSGRLIGFVSGEEYRDDGLAFRGKVDKIYLLRDYQGLGQGRRLRCGAAGRFLAHGIPSLLLFGDAASPSNGFYEAMGGERLHGAAGEFHGGYGWRDLTHLHARCGQ